MTSLPSDTKDSSTDTPVSPLLLATVAGAVRRMAATSSRKELRTEVVDLLEQTSGAELGPLIYLLQGRLTAGSATTSGLNDLEYLIEVVADAYAVTPALIRSRLNEQIDLGDVVATLPALGGGKLTLLDAYRQLLTLAASHANPSFRLQKRRVRELFEQLDADSSFFIVRLLLGRLHLHVGDATLLDALSQRVCGSKHDRPLLQQAYAHSADLGAVAVRYLEQGIAGLDAFTITLGHPVQPMLAERLATASDIVARMGEVAVEGKYAGLRIQVHKQGPYVRLFGRTLEELTPHYPEIVAATLHEISAQDAIFEGELLAVNPASSEFLPLPPLSEGAVVAQTPAEFPLRLIIFDLLFLEGADTTKRSYSERRAKLVKIVVPGSQTLVAAASEPAARATDVERLFLSYVSEGLEGIVCKKISDEYTPGTRGFSWVKLKRVTRGKLSDTLDCVVVGYNLGHGNRQPAGALLLAVYDSDTDEYVGVAKLGTGLTSGQLQRLVQMLEPLVQERRPQNVRSRIIPDFWVIPQMVLEISAEEIIRIADEQVSTSVQSHYSLRHPRLIRVRLDKLPPQATSTIELEQAHLAQTQVALKPARFF